VQVWRQMYDPNRPFRAWASSVVRRYCYDVFGRRLRAVGGDAPFPDVVVPATDAPDFDSRHDFTTPFCSEDRAAVLARNPGSRFVLLAWHGLWDKLTEDDQRQTLAAVAPAATFPVADFCAWPDKDRTRYLARALRCPTNTVAKICLRHRHRLTALRFVRQIAEA